MSDKEKQILKTFEKVIPELSELEKEKLLSFGEGMAFKSQELKKKDNPDGKEGGANASIKGKRQGDEKPHTAREP